jgi:hypothetical protein
VFEAPSALLSGLIYDDRSNIMSPTYSVRRGNRYRYYISSALLHERRGEAGSQSRVNADDVERLVIDVLGRAASNPASRRRRRASALHYMHYNFCRIHETLRVTPAMAAGVTDRVWSIRDIVAVPTAGGIRCHWSLLTIRSLAYSEGLYFQPQSEERFL